MSKEMAYSSGGGIGFVGLLTILFIAFKLAKIIDWEWIWILSPLWISFGLGIIGLIIFGIIYLFIKK